MSKRGKRSFKDINKKYSFLDDGVEGLKNRNATRDEKSREKAQRQEERTRETRASRGSKRVSRNQDFRDHTIKMDAAAIEKERRRLEVLAMRERQRKSKRARLIGIGLSIVGVIVLAILLKTVLDGKTKKNVATTEPTNVIETINSDETTTLKGFVLVSKGVKYYQESNTSSTELGDIAAGTYLENYGVTNGFNKIKYNGVDGYVESSNLSSVKNPEQLKVIKGLPIVNDKYSLPEEFQPGMNVQAKTNFDIMARKAKEDDVIIKIASDYRSYEQQKTNGYTDGVSAYGEYKADGSEVEPGNSEHQTGLAFDVVGEDYENKYNENFADSKEYKWLLENAHKYGFIIRYPKDKENITGRKFEPWHIRFVEPTVADEMHKNNLSLEEYLGLSKVEDNNEDGNAQSDNDNNDDENNVDDENQVDVNNDENNQDDQQNGSNNDNENTQDNQDNEDSQDDQQNQDDEDNAN
ncbi:M15 family metallopeptidase [Lagierella sp.]|uniref:M15 family metallopeptidase n=1 Tax=Lagierella sp. TaxID=2849657 RepID=UPI002622D75A|nr:M15 family metallopeptidase [Lagierella sp.]